MGMWELSKHSFNGNLRKAVKHRKNSCLTKWKCLLMRHKRVKLRPETKSYMQTDDKNSCKKKNQPCLESSELIHQVLSIHPGSG